MFAVHRSVFVITLVVLAGCANTISQRDSLGNPRLERLSAAEIERIQPATPAKLTAADLVRLSRDGFSPNRIIERYQQSGSRLKLESAQVADLQQRGVDKRVLDYVQHEEKAEQVDALTREADRDAAARDRAERARRLYYYRHGDPWVDLYPYWRPRIYPYAGYGSHRWGRDWHGGVTIGF
jgi:hypothetical protein